MQESTVEESKAAQEDLTPERVAMLVTLADGFLAGRKFSHRMVRLIGITFGVFSGIVFTAYHLIGIWRELHSK